MFKLNSLLIAISLSVSYSLKINLVSRRKCLTLYGVPQLDNFLPVIGFYSVMLAPIYGNIIGKMTDFKTVSPRNTPNEELICPPSYCPNYAYATKSPVFLCNKSTLSCAWDKMISMQPRISNVADDPTTNRKTVVQRSFLCRWPDVITVQFIDLDGGKSTLAMHSYSIYGASDLGVNANRVSTWMSALTDIVNTK
eukprot:gene8901-18422_t